MIRVLFLIHDLGQGGAEKVLVNLVNNMDPTKFDITVVSLFGGGVNEQFLKPHIKYHAVFPKAIPGNSHLMKLLTPEQLHRVCVKECYDIEVSYLEGPSARVISGCNDPSVKLITWIHSNFFSEKELCNSFRSFEEARACYGKFNRIVCVSRFMKENFCSWMPNCRNVTVLYNTVESELIRERAKEEVSELKIHDRFRMCAVGSLKAVKGFDRLLNIAKKLKLNGYCFELIILGIGPLKNEFEEYVQSNGLSDTVRFLGYQTNPYKFVSKCDLFICSSYSEGFSTATTEALILGTPVCTTEVSGMKELLGENNDYGIITDNNEESLLEGIKSLLDNRELLSHYRKQAFIRGQCFEKGNTVHAVEEMLLQVGEE